MHGSFASGMILKLYHETEQNFMLVVFYLIVLLQILSQLCFCLKDLIKIVRPLLAAASNNGLMAIFQFLADNTLIVLEGTQYHWSCQVRKLKSLLK